MEVTRSALKSRRKGFEEMWHEIEDSYSKYREELL